ncbi:hypothetical protein PHYPO_G00127880 [Pangasianodon hypophthalmus]|uniref:Uncharacterized protein n=1 Tax=Pangasianodon hypophthalmus TaxID=310915 RepID=A0A5N5KS43_PANHP|nr:hypothetical protein PHYPO_G00127880 [Pangasianodon hypophthalmus]
MYFSWAWSKKKSETTVNSNFLVAENGGVSTHGKQRLQQLGLNVGPVWNTSGSTDNQPSPHCSITVWSLTEKTWTFEAHFR